jgi:type I restriction enzyme, S subunit
MSFEWTPFTDLLSAIVDNRGRTCPVGDSGFPLIATNCIDSSSLYPRYETTRFVSDETYQTWFRGHPEPGDILFVCKGSPGRTNWVPDPVDFCIAQDMVSVRADQTKIYPKYLFAALRSSVVQSQIDNMHVGTMIPHFKKGDFGKLNIPVPSRTAQHEIGDFYFSISERITLLRQTNATLEAITQALFKSWFVDFEPVHAKMQGRSPEGMDEVTASLFPDSFENSELRSVPRGWRISTLDTIAQLNPESWSAKNHPDRIHYIDLANTKAGQIDGINEFSFSEAPSRARRVLRHGDVIVGTVRPGNRSFARIAIDELGLTGSTGFAVLRAREAFDQALVYIAATSDDAIDRLAHLADGGAYPAVRPEVVSNAPLVIAPESIRKAFGEVANAFYSNVGVNQERMRQLALIRDALLPRLISGDLQMEEAQQSIQEVDS